MKWVRALQPQFAATTKFLPNGQKLSEIWKSFTPRNVDLAPNCGNPLEKLREIARKLSQKSELSSKGRSMPKCSRNSIKDLMNLSDSFKRLQATAVPKTDLFVPSNKVFYPFLP